MEKHIIKGNNWMTPQQRRRVWKAKLIAPILAVVIAVSCIIGGVALADSSGTYTMTEVYNAITVVSGIARDYSGSTVTISSSMELMYFYQYFELNNSTYGYKGPYSNITFQLTDNVEMAEYITTGWPIFSNGNTFDGCGHTISGVHMSTAQGTDGLFWIVDNCTIKNLTISGTVTAPQVAGGFAAWAYSNVYIENCVNNCDVTLTGNSSDYNYAGGIIGCCTNNSGTASNNAAGVQIVNCVNNGKIHATGKANGGQGGIVGGFGDSSSSETSEGYLRIDGCVNNGEVQDYSGSSYVRGSGGIIGFMIRDSISADKDTAQKIVDILRCTNYGFIESDYHTGGIVGTQLTQNKSTLSDYRGSNRMKRTRLGILYCNNYGEVSLYSTQTSDGHCCGLGGIVGCITAEAGIAYCNNYGDVNVTDGGATGAVVGGIVGANWIDGWYNDSDDTVDMAITGVYSCANYGNSNCTYFGGIVGDNCGELMVDGVYTQGVDTNGKCKAFYDVTDSAGTIVHGSFWGYRVYCRAQDNPFYLSGVEEDGTTLCGTQYKGSYLEPSTHSWPGENPSDVVSSISNFIYHVLGYHAMSPNQRHYWNKYSGGTFGVWAYGYDYSGRYYSTSYFNRSIGYNNPLYWGIRQNDDDYGTLYVTQGLRVIIIPTLNGSRYASGHIWRLYQDGEPIYDEAIGHEDDGSWVYFDGVLPGEYQLYCDGVEIENYTVTAEDFYTRYQKSGNNNCYQQKEYLYLYQGQFAGTADGYVQAYASNASYDSGKSEIVVSGTSITTPETVKERNNGGVLPTGLYFDGWVNSFNYAKTAIKDTTIEVIEPGAEVTPGVNDYTYYPVIRREGVAVAVYNLASTVETTAGNVALYQDGEKKLTLTYTANSNFYNSVNNTGQVYVGVPAEDGTYEIWVKASPEAVTAKDPRVNDEGYMFTGRTFTYSADTHSYAEFTISRMKVYYEDTHLAAGNTLLKTEYTFDDLALSAPSDPKYPGYAFSGWTTDKSKVYTNPEPYDLSKGVVVTSNCQTTLYAIWQELDGAIVRATLDGGAYAGRAVTLRQQGEVKYNLSETASAGTYKQQVIENDGTYDVYVDDVNTNRTMEVEAKCGSATVSFYTVTFHLNDSRSGGTDKVITVPTIAGQTVDMPADPTYVADGKPYQLFEGWCSDAQLTKTFDTLTEINGKVDVYAKTTAVTGVNVSFTKDGSAYLTAEDVVTLRQGTEVSYTLTNSDSGHPEVYYATGDVADGSYDIYLNSVPVGRSVSVEKHSGTTAVQYVTVKCVWQERRDGIVSASNLNHEFDQVVLIGDRLSAPGTPEETGRVFRYWGVGETVIANTVTTLSDPYDFDKVVDGAFTLYAQFEDLEGVRVRYRLSGAVVAPDATGTSPRITLRVDKQAIYTMSFDASKQEYFVNPSAAAPGGGQTGDVKDGVYELYVDNVNSGKSITVTEHSGYFDLSYFKVDFCYADGTVYETAQVFSGDTATPPDAPAKEGYRFAAWKITGDPDELDTAPVYDFNTAVDANLTLYATFEKKEGATVTVTKNSLPYSDQVVTLRQEGEVLYTLPAGTTVGTYHLDILKDDTYDIYINDVDTGRTITVDDGGGSAIVSYYDVTFYAPDGTTVYKTVPTVSEQAVEMPADPKIDDMVFEGWYADSEFSKAFDAAAEIMGEVSVYAKMLPITGADVTITRNGAAATGLTVTLRQGNEIAYAAPASATGGVYHWDNVADGTYQIYISDIDTGRTVTITKGSGSAKVTCYDVVFHYNDKNDSTRVETVLVVEGQYVQMPDTPVYDKAVFEGWFTDTAFTWEFDGSKPITAKNDVYAKVVDITGADVTITRNGAAATGLTVTLRQGNEIAYTAPASATDGLYHCDNVKDGTYQIYIGDIDTGRTVTITKGSGSAKVTCYDVVFHYNDKNDSTRVETVLVVEGQYVQMPDTPVYVNGVFEGWFSDAAFTWDYDDSKPINAKTDVYAKVFWYTGVKVTLTLNGGTYADASAVTLRQQSEIVYTLTKQDGTNDYIAASDDITDGVYQIYINGFDTGRSLTITNRSGRVALAYFSVTFYKDALIAERQLVLSGAKASEPTAAPKKEGYQFVSWKTAANPQASDPDYDFDLAVDRELTLYAFFEQNAGANVAIMRNGIADPNLTVTLRQQGEIIYTLDAPKAGSVDGNYHLDVVDDGTYDVYIGELNTGRSIEIVKGSGSVGVTTYDVTFHYNDASDTTEDVLVVDGQTVVLPEEPVYPDGDFEGWYTDRACTREFDSAAPITGKTNAYAKVFRYEGIHLTVTLDGADYSGIEVSLRQNDEIVYALSRDGATNVFVYTGVDTLTDGSYAIFINGYDTGRTLTISRQSGIMTLPYFTVSFYESKTAGTPWKTQTVLSGSTVAEPTEHPSQIGGLFDCWLDDSDAPYDFAKAVDGTLALYASWNLVEGVNVRLTENDAAMDGAVVTLRVDGRAVYTLAPDSSDGRVFHIAKDAKGDEVDPRDASDGDYQIYVDGEDTGKSITITNHSGAADIAFYTVHFKVDVTAGIYSEYETKRVSAGETVTAPAETPTRTGKMFNAWSTAADGSAYSFKTAVDHELTLYATWIESTGIGVKVTKDGNAYTGTVTLRLDDEVVYEMVSSKKDGYYTMGEKTVSETVTSEVDGVPVSEVITYTEPIVAEDGEYNIYVGGMDSGRTLVVSQDNGTAVVTLFTVTFYVDSGSGNTKYYSKLVPAGGVVNAPTTTPTSSKGEFVAWTLKDGTPYDFASQVDTTLNLYAQLDLYGAIEVTVKEDGNIVTDADVTLCKEGETIYVLAYDKTDKTYQLTGNDYAADGTYNIYVDNKDSGRTLTVQKRGGSAKVSFATVTYYLEDGTTVYKTKRELIGAEITPPADPEKVGFVFSCWTSKDGVQYDFTEPLVWTTDLYANWDDLDFAVSAELENAELDGRSRTAYTAAYNAKIVPEDGYLLPETIKVTMDESPFTGFTYDPATGVVSIPACTIVGDVVISGSAIPVETYHLVNNIKNSVLYGAYADTKDGYLGVLVANTGYGLPQTITAKMKDEPFTDFTYDAATGKITVSADKVCGTLAFSGECVPTLTAESYKVVSAVGHGRAKLTSASTAAALELTITPYDGYTYPQNVIITSGNKRFTDFTYDPATGTLKIGTGKVTSIVVAATCPSTDVSGIKLTEKNPVRKSLIE